MGTLLDDILAHVESMGKEEQEALENEALELTKNMAWIPNPGPQTEAYFSEADELFYGGQAGGGKSDLAIGLSLNDHRRSLVLRRTHSEALKLVDRYVEILGHKDGWNGQNNVWRIDGRIIDIGGCQHEDDKQKRKGNPHDLICFDEVSDFSESQYTFIIGWNRSADANQRCRVVATGNPPTKPEGLWIMKRWAAWLDPKHPNPAQPGELRYYTTIEGKDTEVEGRGPHMIDGKPVFAKSRTFIRAKLSDNPDLAKTDYDSVLAGLPEEFRAAYREGRFDLSLKDGAFQVIPTDWIRQAQARWTERAPEGVPMCAIGSDVACGGEDETVLSIRHDGWFAPFICVPGKKTPKGSDVAGLIVANRRDGAVPVIDMGGGYGGEVLNCLEGNEIKCVAHKGAVASTARTKDGHFGFTNKRSEVIWKFREALDPSQLGGSNIALPDSPEMVADLTAPTFHIAPGGKIKVESKEDVCKRIGRSTDRGDAVVMAWSAGPKIADSYKQWKNNGRPQPRAVMGHQNKRRR